MRRRSWVSWVVGSFVGLLGSLDSALAGEPDPAIPSEDQNLTPYERTLRDCRATAAWFAGKGPLPSTASALPRPNGTGLREADGIKPIPGNTAATLTSTITFEPRAFGPGRPTPAKLDTHGALVEAWIELPGPRPRIAAVVWAPSDASPQPPTDAAEEPEQRAERLALERCIRLRRCEAPGTLELRTYAWDPGTWRLEATAQGRIPSPWQGGSGRLLLANVRLARVREMLVVTSRDEKCSSGSDLCDAFDVATFFASAPPLERLGAWPLEAYVGIGGNGALSFHLFLNTLTFSDLDGDGLLDVTVRPDGQFPVVFGRHPGDGPSVVRRRVPHASPLAAHLLRRGPLLVPIEKTFADWLAPSWAAADLALHGGDLPKARASLEALADQFLIINGATSECLDGIDVASPPGPPKNAPWCRLPNLGLGYLVAQLASGPRDDLTAERVGDTLDPTIITAGRLVRELEARDPKGAGALRRRFAKAVQCSPGVP